MDPTSLAEFVARERRAAEADARVSDLLSVEALVDRGPAVTGLRRDGRLGREVVLRCERNDSRLRAGDRVVLRSEPGSFAGTLVDVLEEGTRLLVLPDKAPPDSDPGPWTAAEADLDLTPIVLAALRKVQPGAPGWSFFRALAGQSAPRPAADDPDGRAAADFDSLVGRGGTAFDATQAAVIRTCLGVPSLFGAQGPPGTGKTRVLAHARPRGSPAWAAMC